MRGEKERKRGGQGRERRLKSEDGGASIELHMASITNPIPT